MWAYRLSLRKHYAKHSECWNQIFWRFTDRKGNWISNLYKMVTVSFIHLCKMVPAWSLILCIRKCIPCRLIGFERRFFFPVAYKLTKLYYLCSQCCRTCFVILIKWRCYVLIHMRLVSMWKYLKIQQLRFSKDVNFSRTGTVYKWAKHISSAYTGLRVYAKEIFFLKACQVLMSWY